MRVTMMAVVMLAAMLVAVAAPAGAEDTSPCTDNLVCASKPSSVYSEMRAMERSAKLKKDSDGDPMIEVDGPTYKYVVMFMDCEKNAQCAAITFSARFDLDPVITVVHANRWNANHRVPKAFIDKDGELYLQMEISTVGGLTRANFRDLKAWWDSGLRDYSDYFDKESAERDPKNRT